MRLVSRRGSALTQAAGYDIGAVLGKNKGIDQRQVHLQGGAEYKGALCSVRSIFEGGAAVHARVGWTIVGARVALLCVADDMALVAWRCGSPSGFEQRPLAPHAHPLPPPSPHLSTTVLPLQSASFTVTSTPAFTGEL